MQLFKTISKILLKNSFLTRLSNKLNSFIFPLAVVCYVGHKKLITFPESFYCIWHNQKKKKNEIREKSKKNMEMKYGKYMLCFVS